MDSLEKTQKWDKRFLKLAKEISSWSLDPSTQVGAIIVDEKRRLVSAGYNGLAQKLEDTTERLNNRDLKLKIIIHAERNALLFANKSVENCILYTYPFMPCATCCAMIIQAGIKRCVAPWSDNPRWKDDFELSQQMFKEAGVEVVLLDPAIFKEEHKE
jgi:dCMP deaminase